jgi:hypothetical protein
MAVEEVPQVATVGSAELAGMVECSVARVEARAARADSARVPRAEE